MMAVIAERVSIRRLYDRLGFGANAATLSEGRSFDQVADRLLDPAAIAEDPGVKATPAPAIGPPPAQPGKANKGNVAVHKQYATALVEQQSTVIRWWLDRMVAAKAPAAERITWFWHGHFATGAQKVKSPEQMLEQNQTQRRLGLGGFAELAHAMITDPATLRWLDGENNRVGAPNENLAREFMELFALGIGHYSEDDVRSRPGR